MDNINTSNQQMDIIYEQSERVAYNLIKRVADVVLSLFAIIVLSPIFIIVALVVRFDSKGKVIFGHERIGKNMRKFKIYKFRTMYENSQEIFNNFTEEQKKEYYINFKLDNDPRITKVGGFLRKTSLDELPQLFNILKGDMSIVGPRPIVEKEISKYGKYAEVVFSVLPGLTGYWQANGRSDTTYDERVQMDIHYINNRSLLMDFKIILKTFISVIKKDGAI
ncbi:sugar transferase [Clostridium nigeriense]|uniref:sugar transferase n=1 Tax=Clostridium nigeriense TaxID=1805470 RepID=UPI000836AFF6|nr:sugar transferase [Clostridium nigeriense]